MAVYPFPPPSDFPVLCVRFRLDPRNPVCTDLSMFPKWRCRSLSVLFLFLVNMASYYSLPWGLSRSLLQNEHLAGSAGDAALNTAPQTALVWSRFQGSPVISYPISPGLPRVVLPRSSSRWLLSLVSVYSSSSYAVSC